MAKIEFQLQGHVNDGAGSSTPLPITIRHLSTRIAARGLTGRSLELSPGRYLASVELPDGSAVVEKVEVAKDAQVVSLGAQVPKAGASYSKMIERLKYVDEAILQAGDEFIAKGGTGPKAAYMPDLDSLANEAAAFARQRHEVRTSVPDFAGDPLPAAPDYVASEVIGSPHGTLTSGQKQWEVCRNAPGLVSVHIDGSDQANRYALFQHTGATGASRRLAVAIPAAAGRDVEFTLTVASDLRVIPVLENAKANALVSYLAEQSYSNISAYVEGDVAGGFKDLLYSKLSDPVGAAIGGYGLLSVNRYSPLEKWSENLTRLAPWLADGFAIHGETQARLGNHDKAAEFFLEMIRVGIPIFSAGLSYAEARMRVYSRHGKPSKEGNKEMDAWLEAIAANVLPKLRLGEVLTTIINPEIAGVS